MAKLAVTELPYKPYGLLTADEQTTLHQAKDEGFDLEFYFKGQWQGCSWPSCGGAFGGGWNDSNTYRAVCFTGHSVQHGDVVITYTRFKDEIRDVKIGVQ